MTNLFGIFGMRRLHDVLSFTRTRGPEDRQRQSICGSCLLLLPVRSSSSSTITSPQFSSTIFIFENSSAVVWTDPSITGRRVGQLSDSAESWGLHSFSPKFPNGNFVRLLQDISSSSSSWVVFGFTANWRKQLVRLPFVFRSLQAGRSGTSFLSLRGHPLSIYLSISLSLSLSLSLSFALV